MSDDLWTPPAVEPERPPASSPAERRAKRRAERATNAPRKRRPARVIVMVLAAVLVLGGGGVFLLRDQIFGSPLSPEQQAAALLQEAERRDSMRQDMIVEAHTLMQTTGSMVDDVSTLDALAEAITQAESVHFQRVPDGGDSGDETSGTGTSSTETSSTATSSAGNPASSPEALVLHAQGQLDAQTQALDQLRAAVDAVKESNNAYLLVGAVEEARAQAEVLQPILNQAEDLLMSSENAVTNETVRKDLADHITQAHRVMEKIHGNHADAYTERAVLRAKSAEDLVTAMDAVTQSHEAFVAAHAQAEAATDAAQHPTAGSWPRYETDYLMAVAERIVDGVQEADNRFEDHPEAGGASAMDVLSVTLDALTEQDVPPGQDAARYTELIAQAREGFTSAGDQLQQGHIAEAAETYMKARTITGDLLVMISGATGTVYVLPAWSFH